MKMFAKSTVLAGVTAALLGFSVSAAAVGQETWNGLQWTPGIPDNTASFDITTDSTKLVLTGSNINDPNPGSPIDTTFITASTTNFERTVTFHWSYVTNDISPAYDPARFLLNGTPNLLTKAVPSSGPDTVTTIENLPVVPATDPPTFSDQEVYILIRGDESFTVKANQQFGFSVNSQDGAFGAGTLTISNFNVSAVPEPGSLVMLTAGLMVVAAARRRKQY